MKSIDRLNYYEILQIPINASAVEIKQAYRDALSIYDEEAMATYSLFSNNERDTIVKAIETAYLTLIDENKRATYDRMLVETGQINESIITRDQRDTTSLFQNDKNIIEENLVGPLYDGHTPVKYSHQQKIMKTIDTYIKKIENRQMSSQMIKNRFKLLRIKEKVDISDNLPEIEQQLLAILVEIEEPPWRIRRNVSIVVFSYSLLALASFISLTVTDAIMLPSFNIPYLVLLMGFVGCLVSMAVKLPSIRIKQPLKYNPIVWFIIGPPVAVIMAGISFGIVQIFLEVFQFEVSDESWILLILAWIVGFFNWVYLYERLNYRTDENDS
jgi:curved DNA-binding protein CbpA